MSKTLQQIFTTNPITSNLSTDLMYFVQSPYTPGTDAGMTFANFAAQFITSSTIINPAHGGTGVNNGTNTLTLGGNTAFSGAFTFIGTLTGNTGVTFPTSGTLATTSQLPTPAALTEVNDTNVTLTLGGTPLTALLQAVSITAGWTGTLSGTRGGTGINNGANTITLGGSISTGGAFTLSGAFASTFTFTNTTGVTFPTSGTLATTSQLPTPAAMTQVNDTNVTLALGGTPATSLLQAVSLTMGWTGTLAGSRGGLGAAITASNGGIYYSNASNGALLAGTATAQQILMSGASTTPQWSTTTYPLTNAINTIMYASSANVLGSIAAANNGTLITSATGVPSWLANGTTGQVLTATTGSSPSWQPVPGLTPAALTSGNDTNVTLTLGGTPSTALLQAASITAGWTGTLSLARGGTAANLTASNGGIFYSTASAGAILAGTATAGQLLTSGASTTPAWTTTTYPATNAINTLLYASASNVMSALSTANNGMLITSATGVPSILAGPGTTGNMLISNAAAAPSFSTYTYPTTVGATGSVHISNGTNIVSSTSLWPNTVGTSGQVVISNGTSNVYSTPTFPNASATTRKIIVSDGTNWVASTETYAVPSTSGNVMTSDGTNWTSATAASSLPAGTLFNFQATTLNTTVTVTGGTYADITGLNVSITPTSSSNKVLVRAVIQFGVGSAVVTPGFQLVRGSTAIGIGAAAGSRTLVGSSVYNATAGNAMMMTVLEWIDSPATTSATTYKVQTLDFSGSAGTVYLNRGATDANLSTSERAASMISACEIHS